MRRRFWIITLFVFVLLIVLNTNAHSQKNYFEQTDINLFEKDSSFYSDTLKIIKSTLDQYNSTAAITTLNEDDFNKGITFSPEELLIGKIPGLIIINKGGSPHAESYIRLRGITSLFTSNDPLFIIDGVRLDNTNFVELQNSLSTINTNDVESITILKDLASQTIYGKRGANGVIIINTKKGKKNESFQVNYNIQAIYNKLTRTYDVFSSEDFRNLIEQRADNEYIPSIAENLLGNANTNWQKEILSNSVGQNHNLSFQGGIKQLPYYASIGFLNQNGLLETDEFNRTNYSLSLTPDFFKNHLNIRFDIKGMQNKNRYANQRALNNAVVFDPTQPVYDETSPYGGYFTWTNNMGYPMSIATYNPVALINLTNDRAEINNRILSFLLKYKLHFLPDFKFTLRKVREKSNLDGTLEVPNNAAWYYDPFTNDGGRKSNYIRDYQSDILDFNLCYSKSILRIKSKIKTLAGYSKNKLSRFQSNYQTNSSGSMVIDDYESSFEFSYVACFGTLNYSYNDKYFLDFSIRKENNPHLMSTEGLSYATALAWSIKDENFMKQLNNISNLKLRIGYSMMGLKQKEVTPPDLKKERITGYDLGINYGILKNRIYGTFDYYRNKAENLIVNIPSPWGTNLGGILANGGTMESKGFEATICIIPVKRKQISWRIGTNYNHNLNKLISLNQEYFPDNIIYTGQINGGIGNTVQVFQVGQPFYMYYVLEQIYNTDGKPIENLYVDIDDNDAINNNDKYNYKSPSPSSLIDINSMLNYKKWFLDFSGRLSLENYNYNNNESVYGTYSNIYSNYGYLNNLSTDVYNSNFEENQLFSDYYIQDASFFRMDYISLGYHMKLPKNKFNFKLSATIQNAFVITKYKGLDPEVIKGIDNNLYPKPRIFSFKLNIGFINH